MNILPRSAWTSSKPSSNGSWGYFVKGIAVHYPADGKGVRHSRLTRDAIKRLINAYRDYHIRYRGWADIGYNFAIDPAGRIWDLRGLDNVGAHCASLSNKDANTVWVGVLFIVGDDEPISAEARSSFAYLRSVILRKWSGATRVVGHKQVPGASTSCPGLPLMTLINNKSLVEDDMAGYDEDRLIERIKKSLELFPRIEDQGKDWAPSTILRRQMILLREDRAWRKQADALFTNILSALNAAQNGEPFDENKLLDGVKNSAKEGATEAVEERMSEIVDEIRAIAQDDPDVSVDDIVELITSKLGHVIVEFGQALTGDDE